MYITYQFQIGNDIFENVIESGIKSRADGEARVQELQETASPGGEIYFFREVLDGDFNNGQKFVGRAK